MSWNCYCGKQHFPSSEGYFPFKTPVAVPTSSVDQGLGVIGVVVYGFSLRVIPASARRAALEGADPFAVQTSFWIALLMIFAATLALALLSLRKAADRLVPGIGVGFGIVGLLLVLSNYVTFYFFR